MRLLAVEMVKGVEGALKRLTQCRDAQQRAMSLASGSREATGMVQTRGEAAMASITKSVI